MQVMTQKLTQSRLYRDTQRPLLASCNILSHLPVRIIFKTLVSWIELLEAGESTFSPLYTLQGKQELALARMASWWEKKALIAYQWVRGASVLRYGRSSEKVELTGKDSLRQVPKCCPL